MGLEFYDHTGELVKAAPAPSSARPATTSGGLLVGSEGTLGMISRAILKLVPPPQASKAMMAVFDNVQKDFRSRWPASSPPTSCPVRWNSWTT